jgi:glycine oxidase
VRRRRKPILLRQEHQNNKLGVPSGHSYTVADGRSFDVIVVGNGALGLSLGLVLARRGVRVAVSGHPTRPWSASVAAGAMNGCFGEVTSSLLESAQGRAKLEMDVQATQLWDNWADGLIDETGSSAASLRNKSGTVVMLNAVGVPGVDTDNYRAIRSALQEYDTAFEDIDAAELDWLRPEPTSRPMSAIFIPGEHSVDSALLLRCLETAFVQSGGQLLGELVARLDADETGEGVVRGVVLASGTSISADVTVLAAGARSHKLLEGLPDLASRVPPMVSGYGVSALVETEDGTVPEMVIRTPNRAFACGLHIVPRSPGVVYLGATNIISEEPRTTAAISDLTFLLGCAVRQLHADLSEGGIQRVQVGNRPVPLDGFPLIGPTDAEGLWMMTGTYRDGLHQSPLLADELANQILGGEVRPEFKDFTPVRRPIQAMTRDEAVDATVVHMMATGYEHNWDVPAEWPPRMERHLRRWYRQVANELDPEFTPPPEIIAALYPGIEAQLRRYYAAYRDAAPAPRKSTKILGRQR